MKNKKLSAWIATAAMAMTTSISAQNITRLNISPTPVDKNVPVSLQIEFINTGARAWCGLDISWGNGTVTDIRVGEDNRKDSGFVLQNTYPAAGTYTVSVQGRTKIRGLNSASSCDVSAAPVVVVVKDPAIEAAAQREKEMAAELARMREEAAKKESALQEKEFQLRAKEIEARVKREEEQRRSKAAPAPAATAPAPTPAPVNRAVKPADGF